MATLKSIKNKYLTNSDGTVLGVTTNTENVSLLSFKLATADSLSKFNLVDGFADDYNDATGVDAGGSTNELRDASGKYYSGWLAGSPTTTSFTTVESTTWTVPTGVTDVEYLVVGGGGGGSGGTPSVNFGGGGAGGVVKAAASYTVVPAASLTVTVGAGGTATTGAGNAGASSVFATITATAGNGSPTGHTGATNADYSGGSTSGLPGPGGAGAGANGSGMNGGNGVANSITGSSTYYGGGGAGTNDAASGTPGLGGGGAGGGAGTASPANTGGGGGGGNGASAVGHGGSGIVILKYTPLNEANLTLVSNAYTAQTEPDTVRIMIDEYTSTGSATINTDIKAYASRDGSTWTQITSLASQGTIETNHRYLSGSVDVSGQPSGTSVKYKIETLNQSASKVTRMYGTSMAWA